jgi:ferredoxin
MDPKENPVGQRKVTGRDGLDALIVALRGDGFDVIGPRVRDGAVVLESLDGADDLPWGWADEQEGGRYRLVRDDSGAAFAHVVGPHSWKKHLFPARQLLWRGDRRGSGFTITAPDETPRPTAFLGVRGCDLAAIAIQDRVFGVERPDGGPATVTEPGYAGRRAAAFIVAVNCARSAATCFCESMGTGPAAGPGYDLALTELIGANHHAFLVEAGSPAGARLLERLPGKTATAACDAAAAQAVEGARAGQTRRMVDGVAGLLADNLEHPRWAEVAQRCLSCANCTMVCPTCFCSTVEDTTDLSGDHAERWKRWDSCFTLEHSYIHGGAIRREPRSRYRQWLSHKLSTWHDQFGTSGCTGCGRCITWCPVGIDITEEARAIHAHPLHAQGTDDGGGNTTRGA